MTSSDGKRRMPSGAMETSPLLVGLVGISIPVALLAAAAVSESVIVLIAAVVAMFAVGAATLTFVMMLAADSFARSHGDTPGD